MSLNKYLGGLNIEGHSQQVPQQIHLLKQFCKIKRIKNIMEIGFNAGHSSEIFLEYNNHLSPDAALRASVSRFNSLITAASASGFTPFSTRLVRIVRVR